MQQTRTQSTPPNPYRDANLRAAMASPELAARHDKDGWLGLYSHDAVVEDPVGTRPSRKGSGSRGQDELGRFYDAFISRNDIVMSSRTAAQLKGALNGQPVVTDIVCLDEVFRSVTIQTTNRVTGVQMQIPANLLYKVVDEDGVRRVSKMQAHWELSRTSRQIMNHGAKGLASVAVMNYAMLRAFGPRWVGEYFKASQQGVKRAGKESIEALARGLGDSVAHDVFASGARIILPGLAALTPDKFSEGCTALHLGDLIASGDTVTGLSAFEWGGRMRSGALRASFERRKLKELRLFWDC